MADGTYTVSVTVTGVDGSNADATDSGSASVTISGCKGTATITSTITDSTCSGTLTADYDTVNPEDSTPTFTWSYNDGTSDIPLTSVTTEVLNATDISVNGSFTVKVVISGTNDNGLAVTDEVT